MRDLSVAFILIASVPLILVFPHLGIYFWAWVSYMNPHRLGYSFIASWPVAEIVGLATMVAWLFSKEPKKLPMHFLIGMIIAYMVWISVTTVTSMDPALSYDKWDVTVKILLFTLVTCGLITTKNRLIGLVWVITISIGFYGVKGGLFTIVSGGGNHVWGPVHTFIADNNALALALVMTVPLMRFLQLQSKVFWIRWALGGSIALTIFAIFGTQSRGALLAIIAMLVILVLKSRRKAFVLMASVMAMAVALLFMPQSWTDRMMTIQSYQEDGSAQGRLQMWEYAINVANHRPIVGGGFNVFINPIAQRQYLQAGITPRAAHSIFFETLGDHGYVGLGIFLLTLVASFYYAGRLVRLTRRDPSLTWARDLASMMQVSLVGYAVAGTFQNLATFDLYWHLVAIIAITDMLVARALARQTAPEMPQEGPLTTLLPLAPKPRFNV
jgi:probable O-glycosylation ligase (exosortase A-associated)